jgi:hypothetical protein
VQSLSSVSKGKKSSTCRSILQATTEHLG